MSIRKAEITDFDTMVRLASEIVHKINTRTHLDKMTLQETADIVLKCIIEPDKCAFITDDEKGFILGSLQPHSRSGSLYAVEIGWFCKNPKESLKLFYRFKEWANENKAAFIQAYSHAYMGNEKLDKFFNRQDMFEADRIFIGRL